MDILSIIIIALIAFFAVIGIIVGALKGFTRVKSWAVEILLVGVIGIPLSKLIFNSMSDSAVAGIISLGITVLLVCLFMLLFAVLRKLLNKSVEKRKKLAYYKQYDEIEDNTEQILCAIGTEDKKKYKKLSKKKFRQSGGAWGIVDRVFGAIVLAVKGVLIVGFISSFVLVVLDFTRLAAPDGSLYETLGSVYTSGGWEFFKNYIFDFIIIGIITVCIKSGYSSGITSSLWSLAVIGLIVGSGFLAFSLSFNAADFVAAAEKFEPTVAEWGFIEMLGVIGATPLVVAKIIIGTLVFLLMLVADILIAIFVPKLIDRARDGKIFSAVDGVLGAIVLTALIIGLMLLVGAVANSLHDVGFMSGFNSYFEKSGVATVFYDKNILNGFGLLTDLPFAEWLS